MPKKVHGRPSKGKTRARRPQRPVENRTFDTVEQTGAVPVARTAGPVAAPATARPAAPAGVAPTARRGTQRRAPAITINYDYLRHDLTMLAVIAPLMIVLLVVAFLVLQNA